MTLIKFNWSSFQSSRHDNAQNDKVWDKEREKRKKEKAAAMAVMTSSQARQLTDKDLEGKSEEEIQMMRMMGFANFDTTKGKKVSKIFL